MEYRKEWLCATLFLALTGFALSQDKVEDICIGCICEAASNCNRTAGCHGGMCGLFRITYPYWVDAGKPILQGDDAAEENAWVRCVTDPYCAATALQNYFQRFKKDCNGDLKIDCYDYAAIHHLGGYNCNSRAWDKKYQNQFENCMTSVGHLG